MWEIASKLGFVAGLVGLNAFFTWSETAMLSSRPARLEGLSARKVRGARRALALKAAPETMLSTVQIGITLIGVASGVVGEAFLAGPLEEALAGVPGLEPFARTLSAALVVAGLTYLFLVFGELVPKRAALASPERAACAAAPPLAALASLFRPAVAFLGISVRAALLPFGVRGGAEETVGSEELLRLIREAGRAGAAGTAGSGGLRQSESEQLERLLMLGHKRAATLMRHRTELSWLKPDATAAELAAAFSTGEARILVAGEDMDDALGVIDAGRVAAACLSGKSWRSAIRPPLYVPEGLEIAALLKRLTEDQDGFGPALVALVVDEFGSTMGAVDVHDVLERLTGETETEDEDEPRIVARADGSLLVDGMTPLDETLAELGLPLDVIREESSHSDTIAGLMLRLLGRLPQLADVVEWRGYRLEVVDMDGRRIDKVLISRAA